MSAEADRRLLLLSTGYMLDQLASGRLIFDIVDSLIAVAVAQANVAPVIASRELQLRYATLAHPPPDDLRRPISVNALAQSLRLPFETVRRRLIKLSWLGACRVTSAGVVVPSGVLFAPIHRSHLQRNDELTAALWRQAGGELPVQRRSEGDEPVWAEPPVRILSRSALGYVLRLADQLGEVFDDPVFVVIWAAALEALEAPIRMQDIARRVQLAPETVRRRVHELAARGMIEVTPAGVVASPGFMGSAQIARLAARNRSDLIRLFSGLSDLGVIGYWEGQSTYRKASGDA